MGDYTQSGSERLCNLCKHRELGPESQPEIFPTTTTTAAPGKGTLQKPVHPTVASPGSWLAPFSLGPKARGGETQMEAGPPRVPPLQQCSLSLRMSCLRIDLRQPKPEALYPRQPEDNGCLSTLLLCSSQLWRLTDLGFSDSGAIKTNW